ncbi:MAG: ParB/RepB/Spo0J family partition protein [Caulobacteraceae bacterium]|nr:ParB/RepB/Spo0J family partition protein [Caulobacteraceae bacterium]
MKVNPLALQNLDLLHALDSLDDGANSGDVARQLGRDKSNFNKQLDRLAEEGLIEPGRSLALTPAGMAHARSFAPDGTLMSTGDALALRHDQIEPDPDNERGDDIDTEALDALRESILIRGLLQPVLVTAPPEPGSPHRLVAGEMRWRAIGLAIAEDDWPKDRPIPARLLPTLSPLERDLARLAENLQRADLHPLDEGRGFLRLREAHGLSDDDIAEQVGRGKKHVQDHIRVYQLTPPEDQARMRLPKDDPDHLTYKAAREAMRTPKPKPVIEVTPIEALAIVELADRARRRPSANVVYSGKDGWTELQQTPSEDDIAVAASLAAKGFAEFRTIQGLVETTYARITRAPDLLYWLAERGYPEKLDGAIWSARCEVAGPLGAAQLRNEDRYATDWLNAAVEPPQAEARTEENPVRADPAYGHAPDPELFSADPGPSPGAPPENPAPAAIPPAQPAREPVHLSDVAALALAEIHQAHAQAVFGPQNAYVGVPAWGYWNAREAQELLAARLIKFQPDAARKGYLVCLTELGHARAALENPPPAAEDGRFHTAWLNPPTAPEAAPAEAPKPTGPLSPMLGDSFAQQVREAAEEAEPREPLDADVDLSLEGQIIYLTEWREIVEVCEEPMIDAIIASLERLREAETQDPHAIGEA